MDWKGRLKGLMLETVGRVKKYTTERPTPPPPPSEKQKEEIAKANYEKWRRGQQRVGRKHKEYYKSQLERDDY